MESRGKWLLIYFSGDGILATHMLMNGSWHIYRPGERWQQPAAHMRIVIETSDFVAVGFSVPLAEMHTAHRWHATRAFRPLERSAVARLRRGRRYGAASLLRRHGTGSSLLQQKALAGVGNVFKSEICFAAGLNPFRKVASLSASKWPRLFLSRAGSCVRMCLKIRATRS